MLMNLSLSTAKHHGTKNCSSNDYLPDKEIEPDPSSNNVITALFLRGIHIAPCKKCYEL